MVFFLFVMLLTSSPSFSAKVDPTRPFGHRGLQTVTPEGKKLVLESIIYGDGIYTAVVSGKVMKVNDYIGEYKLTALNKKSAILRSETQRIELNIFKENLVKASVAK